MEPCKTHPRPILKKSGGQSPQPMFAQPKFDVRPPHPQFFSGNESSFNIAAIAATDDAAAGSAANGEIFFESDTLESTSESYPVPSKPSKQERRGRSGNGGKKSVQTTASQDEDPATTASRYKISHLTKKLRDSHIALARKRAAKHLSAIYVFHSREINKEIIKTLIKSTDGFIKDFRRDFPSENYTDIQLFTVFRADFVKRLRMFLLGESIGGGENSGEHGGYTRPHHLNGHEIAFTLSEPIMSDVEAYRRHIEQESKLLAHSKTATAAFSDATAAASWSQNSPPFGDQDVAASLPTNSFFDSYEDEIALRENVLMKTYRSKSIESDEENLLNVQMSQALSKKNVKEKASSIVSAATTTKKIVRFADAFGLDLEKVKIITNNSFVDAFSQEYTDYDNDDAYKSVMSSGCEANKSGLTASSQPFLVLIPLFNLRKFDSFVRLDDYIYDYENKIIRCMVKVKNVAYQKQVFARITNNNWKSHWDLNAMFVKSDIAAPVHLASSSSAYSNSTYLSPSITTTTTAASNYDYFSFFIVIPERSAIHAQPPGAVTNTTTNDQATAAAVPSSMAPGTTAQKASTSLDDCILRIEFALCCKQNGQFYWDNNFGDNYKFQCFFNKAA